MPSGRQGPVIALPQILLHLYEHDTHEYAGNKLLSRVSRLVGSIMSQQLPHEKKLRLHGHLHLKCE